MAPPTLDMGRLPRMASWWLLGGTHGAELQAVTLMHAPQGLHPYLNSWTLRCGQPGVLEQDTVWSAPVTQPSPGSAAGRCLRPFGRSAGWEGMWLGGLGQTGHAPAWERRSSVPRARLPPPASSVPRAAT